MAIVAPPPEGIDRTPEVPHAICGVEVGVGHKPRKDGIPTREYSLWLSMLQRCYNPKVQAKDSMPTNFAVCERWHNYQNFYEDIKLLPNYDRWKLNEEDMILDSRGTYLRATYYSPDTCQFNTNSHTN